MDLLGAFGGVAVAEGGLVGLHSSWDEGTGMRRGVPVMGESVGGWFWARGAGG